MNITSIPNLLDTLKMSKHKLANEMCEDRLYIDEFKYDELNHFHVVIDNGEEIDNIRHRYKLMHVTQRNRNTRGRR